jgi:hypothetical protein
MKSVSQTTGWKMLSLTLICMIFGLGTTAFAVPANQLLRIRSNRTITGKCCFLWGEQVSVNEPTTYFFRFAARY